MNLTSEALEAWSHAHLLGIANGEISMLCAVLEIRPPYPQS